MFYIRRISLLVAAAFLVWRIASSGISEHYVELFKKGDPDAVEKVLTWNSRQPDATFSKGARLLEEGATGGKDLIEQTFRENPTDPRPLLALASIAGADTEVKGDDVRAAALVEKAAQLAPSDSRVQEQVAGFWASRGDIARAMRHWSLAMEADAAARGRLFPLLRKIAEDPKSRAAFKTFARDPPPWWDIFFTRMASQASDPESVRLLYKLRRLSGGKPLTPNERKVYIERLVRDAQITEAYLVWVNGLSDAGKKRLGLLFDGGFELAPSNMGFGWHLRKSAKISANTAATYGVEGEKALHLIFKGRESLFGHAYQRLFLAPGRYRLSGKVRTDSLNTDGGIKWVVRCTHPKSGLVGESERFLGSGEWREFSFDLDVTEDCAAQEIRLSYAGTRPSEQKISGGVWFDGMAIRKVQAKAAGPM